MKSCKNIVKPALCIQLLDEIFNTLQTVCLGCDYYVTIECAQTICAPLLQNAQYATEVRRFSAHTGNRCVMKITKYPDVLALQYWPLFYTHFAIDFSERAILYRYWPRRSWNITFRWTCQESYMLSQGEILLSWHHRHVIFHPSQSISVILDGQNEWFHQNCDGALWI